MEEIPLRARETGPARRIVREVDVLGRPVGVLPIEVEVLRGLQVDVLGGAHARSGIRARMIAEPA